MYSAQIPTEHSAYGPCRSNPSWDRNTFASSHAHQVSKMYPPKADATVMLGERAFNGCRCLRLYAIPSVKIPNTVHPTHT